MKRFGLFGLVLAVSILGACNDNRGGSNFGLIDAQIGEVRMIIGSSPTCVGGASDSANCSPHSDCEDSFCAQICIADVDSGKPCTSNADCMDTCALACDRGIDKEDLCSQDTDCPDGTCTSALIHEFSGFFTYTGDPFVTEFPEAELPGTMGSIDTDGDGDGFTPAVILDTAPLGIQGEIFVDFLDDVEDCVTVTWGPQKLLVLDNLCGDPVEATFTFPQ